MNDADVRRRNHDMKDVPTVLHLTDSLPRNASGKVMKTVLRRQYDRSP